MGPRWSQRGARHNEKIPQGNSWSPLGPILGKFWPIWSRRGPFKPILKPTWHPSCYLQAFKTTRRPPKNHFASFLKVACLENGQKTLIYLCVSMFLRSYLLTTYHPQVSLSKPKICLKIPSQTPMKGAGGPKIAQDGAKMGSKRVRGTTRKSRKIIPGALGPILGPALAKLGSAWLCQSYLGAN